MERNVYRYRFDKATDMQEVEESLVLAILAVVRVRVRLLDWPLAHKLLGIAVCSTLMPALFPLAIWPLSVPLLVAAAVLLIVACARPGSRWPAVVACVLIGLFWFLGACVGAVSLWWPRSVCA
jgi:hypothetical protein